MLCLWSGPPGSTVGSFCSGIQLHYTVVSLSLIYLFLYLALYVLGDDTLISYGSYMRTKHLFFLISIIIMGKVGTVKHV